MNRTAVTILLAALAGTPTALFAALDNCNVRGVNAQAFYDCTDNIDAFAVGGNDFTQAPGSACVWISPAVPDYHFTSAPHRDYGDVHVTFHRTDHHCGAHIVGPERCYPSPHTEDNCTAAEQDIATNLCNAFVQAGHCDG